MNLDNDPRVITQAGPAGTCAEREALQQEVLHIVRPLELVSIVLVLFGAFNWGLVAIFGVDWLGATFGQSSAFTRVVHGASGLAALHCVSLIARLWRGAGEPVQEAPVASGNVSPDEQQLSGKSYRAV